MNDLTKRMATLASAEEFLDFFAIPYDQSVVHVNRLHILKRFNQYLRITPGTAEMDDAALFTVCKELLVRAYGDFVRSTPAQEKVFKVFQDQDGRSVGLDSLRSTLPSHR
jgi:nitrogenase-stabilizing/protective protein